MNNPSVFSIIARFLALMLLVLAAASVAEHQAPAQEPSGFQPGGQIPPEIRARMRRNRGNRGQPQPSAPTPKPEEKKPEDKKEEKKDEKKEETIPTIKRPTDGSSKLDPNRIRLKPDASGLVQFNYNSQPWSDVLQEFADAAGFSFDWQELPADSLNLVTQKKYNLQQARDLLNRHLLARGFTLVVQGEVLSAVKIDKLDPSLVPRVESDYLEDYPPHDFVKVRFQLPQSMDPAKAAEDVKLLLSPNAKVTPLLNTKRLLVIDSVANLRGVRDLIYSEQSAADAIIKPQVYPIRHRRADYVADQVMIVLGLDPAARKTPQELQLETQRMQLFMQMQQQGKDVTKLLSKDGPAVHIAVDRQQNTLLVNAPEELMSTIDRTIKQFDQPNGAELAEDAGGRSMRRHRTASASTDAVVTALMELGNLHPLTQVQSDAQGKVIFAYATESDHEKIEKMIGKLDGSGRQITVLWLKRLSARQVAGTLTTLLVGDDDKEDSSRRGRYSRWGYQEEEEEETKFRAMADVERNRLLLWANADELAEVRRMLAQMGETSDGNSSNPSKVRVLSERTPEETARLLERLKAAFPGKLNIESATEPREKPQPKSEAKPRDNVTRLSPLGAGRFQTVQLQTAPAADEKPAEKPNTEPEVNILVAEDGRIIITSDDPEALNQVEELVSALEPTRQEFHKFTLKYASALNVVIKLEAYFADELKGQTESVFDEWGQYEGKREKDLGSPTLGSRELLRFIDDRYTNTVVVQGASESQLAAIKQLIAIYDQAPKSENYYARKTEVIPLKYSRAQDIAKSIKEVYRELLSSKDKEFQDEEGDRPISGREFPYAFGDVVKKANGDEDPVLINFEGVLSIGVDEVSNSLIISARLEVMDSIKQTVQLLDNAAAPDTMVHVHRVGGRLTAAGMQKMLKESLSQPWPGGKPAQATASASQGGGEQAREGRRDRGNDRDRRRRRDR